MVVGVREHRDLYCGRAFGVYADSASCQIHELFCLPHSGYSRCPGSIPEELGKMDDLKSLNLQSNELTGNGMVSTCVCNFAETGPVRCWALM